MSRCSSRAEVMAKNLRCLNNESPQEENAKRESRSEKIWISKRRYRRGMKKGGGRKVVPRATTVCTSSYLVNLYITYRFSKGIETRTEPEEETTRRRERLVLRFPVWNKLMKKKSSEREWDEKKTHTRKGGAFLFTGQRRESSTTSRVSDDRGISIEANHFALIKRINFFIKSKNYDKYWRTKKK